MVQFLCMLQGIKMCSVGFPQVEKAKKQLETEYHNQSELRTQAI